MDWNAVANGAAYGALLGLAGGLIGALVGALLAPLFPPGARAQLRTILQIAFVVIAVSLIPLAEKKFGPLIP